MNPNEDKFELMLADQVRLKRRQELLTMFAGFEVEQAELTTNPNETNESTSQKDANEDSPAPARNDP